MSLRPAWATKRIPNQLEPPEEFSPIQTNNQPTNQPANQPTKEKNQNKVDTFKFLINFFFIFKYMHVSIGTQRPRRGS